VKFTPKISAQKLALKKLSTFYSLFFTVYVFGAFKMALESLSRAWLNS